MTWQSLARKEFKEHVRPAGKWSGTVIASAIMAILFGAGAALGVGLTMHELGSAPGGSVHVMVAVSLLAGLAGAAFSATLIPMNLGVDAIAGERERHTLQTLLAGPLSDKAILWGKTTAILAVSVLTSLLGAIAVWIMLIILYAQYGLLWGLLTIPIGLIAPILPAFGVTCFAFLFSTRAKTVKDAGQKMGYVMIPFFMLPSLTFSIGSSSPAFTIGVLVIAALIGVLWVVVVPVLAFAGFRRERLLV